jgi:hypothetical protein
MSIEKVEWPRIASVYKDLFSSICPTPEEINSVERILEHLNKGSDSTTRDHFGNKADIIDIDEFKI